MERKEQTVRQTSRTQQRNCGLGAVLNEHIYVVLLKYQDLLI